MLVAFFASVEIPPLLHHPNLCLRPNLRFERVTPCARCYPKTLDAPAAKVIPVEVERHTSLERSRMSVVGNYDRTSCHRVEGTENGQVEV